jgi:hypothetical protein
VSQLPPELLRRAEFAGAPDDIQSKPLLVILQLPQKAGDGGSVSDEEAQEVAATFVRSFPGSELVHSHRDEFRGNNRMILRLTATDGTSPNKAGFVDTCIISRQDVSKWIIAMVFSHNDSNSAQNLTDITNAFNSIQFN